MTEQVRFSVLGPVRARRGADEVDLGSPQQRTVRAALGQRRDRLGGRTHRRRMGCGHTVLGTLRTYVHRLRRALDLTEEPSMVASAGHGYRLDTDRVALDLADFQRLLARAERALDTGEIEEAAEDLRTALGLWQGSALSGIRGEYADVRRRVLEDQRLSAEMLFMKAEIELGSHDLAVGRLSSLVNEHPLDERLREMLMLALYRSGRQAAALTAYRDIQELLAQELGVDPGPGLQTMFQRVLRADSGLTTPSVPARPKAAVRSGPAVSGPPLPNSRPLLRRSWAVRPNWRGPPTSYRPPRRRSPSSPGWQGSAKQPSLCAGLGRSPTPSPTGRSSSTFADSTTRAHPSPPVRPSARSWTHWERNRGTFHRRRTRGRRTTAPGSVASGSCCSWTTPGTPPRCGRSWRARPAARSS